MSHLKCRVDQLHPAAIVSLSGRLDGPGPPEVEVVLRECLAEMPAVLLLEVSELVVTESARFGWLKEVVADAAQWPAIPVYLCGDGGAAGSELPRYPTLAAAKQIWAGARPPEAESLPLPARPSSCGVARAFVAQVCSQWGLSRAVRMAELLTSELVANAVVHARRGLAVTVRRYGRGVELSVRDDGAGHVPTDLQPDPRGFGLQLVDAMSDAWGTVPTGTGKVVWTRLQG